jgi:hypothetical protein
LTSGIVTTVELRTVDPGTLVKSTTNRNDLVAPGFVTVPLATHEPAAGAHAVTATSDRTLSAGSKGTTLLGAMAEVCGAAGVVPGSVFPEDAQAAHATAQTATGTAARQRARFGRIVTASPRTSPRGAPRRPGNARIVSDP